MRVLGSTVAPCRSQFVRIRSHGATSRSCVLTDLYRFGINTAPSIAITTIFVDFFGKESCQFAPGVELMSAIRLG